MKFFRLSGSFFKTGLGKSPLRHSYETLVGLFSGDNREDLWRRTVLCMIHTLLAEKDGSVSSERIETVRRLIEYKRGSDEAARQIRIFKEVGDIAPAEAAEKLADLSVEEKQKLLGFLVLLSLKSNAFDERSRTYIAASAAALGIDEMTCEKIITSSQSEHKTQDKLIRSGAGLIAAIGVIFVFVLTATLLRSVIFGLIGAYLLLPLEKYFEKKIRSGRGLISKIVKGWEICVSPLHKLSRTVLRRVPESADPVSDNGRESDKKAVKQAISLTVLFVAFFAIGAVLFLSSVTGRYVVELKDSVKNTGMAVAAKKDVAPEPRNWSILIESWIEEKASALIEEHPEISRGVEFLRRRLADEKTRKELAAVILRTTGGVVNFTASALGMAVGVISDIILSLVFGLLFLFKLAEFCRTDSSSGRQSEYLIRTVFNGKWLPAANENTIDGARNILSGTFMRLRIWVRGYLLLMLIDATVYTTAFFFLKVPYFPLLGIIAGCGILLPYIGPVFGCLLTVFVTLMLGDGGGMQILGLLLFYGIYSGIIEQFILYPAVIGESLGLTTLETIVVVLLGAVFAGVTGMIFALPAASVIKFIVPKIYYCWGDSIAPEERK